MNFIQRYNDSIRKKTAKEMLELFEITINNTTGKNQKRDLLIYIEQWKKSLT
jgi:hypothetical protein